MWKQNSDADKHRITANRCTEIRPKDPWVTHPGRGVKFQDCWETGKMIWGIGVWALCVGTWGKTVKPNWPPSWILQHRHWLVQTNSRRGAVSQRVVSGNRKAPCEMVVILYTIWPQFSRSCWWECEVFSNNTHWLVKSLLYPVDCRLWSQGVNGLISKKCIKCHCTFFKSIMTYI